MFVHYGLYEGTVTRSEISFETLKEANPNEIIYDTATDKIGIIVNRFTGWEVPEIITLWLDPETDEMICTHSLNIPTLFDENARDCYMMECGSRPAERKAGKIRECYLVLFEKLVEYFELLEKITA